MAKMIKLENITERGYDRATGKPVMEVTRQQICEACHHLVNEEDKFCWQCGGNLEQSDLVEHYHKGERLTNGQFEEERRKLK